MIRRALIALAASIALHGTVLAESPQPTPVMVADATQLFDMLAARPTMSNFDIAAGLARYFGQEVEMLPDPGDPGQFDFYLIRRDPRTNEITFLWWLGRRLR